MMAGKLESYSCHRSRYKSDHIIHGGKNKVNLESNGKYSNRKLYVQSLDVISSPYPPLSPVVRLVNYSDRVKTRSAPSENMEVEFVHEKSCGGQEKNKDCKDSVSPTQESQHISHVSSSIPQFDIRAPQTDITESQDLSDESGIEEPELVRNIPSEGEEEEENTRRSCKGLQCSSDSGSESPDATNIISSPHPAVETSGNPLCENHTTVIMETDLSKEDEIVLVDESDPTPSPSMPCLELEMPILTMEMPVLSVRTINSEECPVVPDSSETVADKGLCMDVASYEDVEQTSEVTSTSDENGPVSGHCLFEKEPFQIKTKSVHSKVTSEGDTFRSPLKSSQENPQKNFLTEFNRFIKKFDAKKVNYQRSHPENRMVTKANPHKGHADSNANPSNPKPAGAKRNPPPSPKRKHRLRLGEKFEVDHVPPIYFTPQNLYQMFINAYWTEHADDHSLKELVLQDAEALWNRKYSKSSDPQRVHVLQFLDSHNARIESRWKSQVETKRRRSEDSTGVSLQRSRSPVNRSASVDLPVKSAGFSLKEKDGETPDLLYPERPKRRRVSNIRYDSDEFAMGNMSDLEELEEGQESVVKETSDDPNFLSEKEVDLIYLDWCPPAEVNVSELLANFTLLLSLKHKVVELLHTVFPCLEYPAHLSTSFTALSQTLDRIEAAVTDAPSTEYTCINNSENAHCSVVLCKDPVKCLHQLRGRVCDFLSIILPDLSFDGSFDRSSDAVEELLEEIIASNKQALKTENIGALCENTSDSRQGGTHSQDV